MSTIAFVYVSDIKLYLDSIRVCFDIIFGVTFINRDMCQWNYCGWCDVSCIFMLFCGKVGVNNVGEMVVLSFLVILGE